MIESLKRILENPGLAAGVSLGLAGMITAVAITLGIVITKNWRRIREREAENALKQGMLEQGFSAKEIERVVCATSLGGKKRHARAMPLSVQTATNSGARRPA